MTRRPRRGRLPRIGLGIDRHPFQAGRRLVLGGLEIPRAQGLAGHSDADVLTHAICDALLGALALPDLGVRFPATSPEWRDRKSLDFLQDIAREMRSHGYALGNLDAVLLAEQPPLLPHLDGMRRLLAGTIGCAIDQIAIKPKRGEGLGFVGRAEGIEAHAIALLVPAAPPKRRARKR